MVLLNVTSSVTRPKYLGSRVFSPVWRLGRTASALGRLQRCCSAPNAEDDLVPALLSMSIALFECSLTALHRCFTLPQETMVQNVLDSLPYILNRISCAVASEREERNIAFSTKRSVLRRRETGPNLTRIEPRASRV